MLYSTAPTCRSSGRASGTPRNTGADPGSGAKLHLAVDAETSKIQAHILTDTDVGDIIAVPVPLGTAEGPIAGVIADGAHDAASGYEVASLRQHDPPPGIVIPLRATSTAATNDDVKVMS